VTSNPIEGYASTAFISGCDPRRGTHRRIPRCARSGGQAVGRSDYAASDRLTD